MPTGNEFTDVRFDGSKSVTRQQENYGTAGDYGQVANAPDAPAVASGDYPNIFSYGPDPVNRQFSSDKEGDPEKLLRMEASDGVRAHADLMTAYGLHLPVATLGSHPWLRDGLADPTEQEPANSEPRENIKVPRTHSVGNE